MNAAPMNLPRQVSIREVGPRDGFQSIDRFIPTADKLDIIAAIADAGVTRMETTSFVSARAIPQLKDAADVMAGISRPGISRYRMEHAAMVPNARGAGHAVAAGVDQLVVVISATLAHNQANVHRTVDESLADLDDIFALSRQHGVPVIGAVAVAFGCPFQGDVARADTFHIARAYVDRGAASVMLADTTGMATPVRVIEMVNAFKEMFSGTELILHFHNNRGTAMANLLAAMTAGARTFDTALGGIGGCPNVPLAAGNLATEDVVFMLEEMGISTGIDLLKIIDAAHLLEKRLGFTLPGQVMKSGPCHTLPCRDTGSGCLTSKNNDE
ncbi:MAG: hydroxymethylglutaryl-CoA lyase [Deltaproteobacteria bacterium]|nr:MAG: hydroxymethylglutaryl-CoA lyase [Deltaproteobacteria bacterium]